MADYDTLNLVIGDFALWAAMTSTYAVADTLHEEPHG